MCVCSSTMCLFVFKEMKLDRIGRVLVIFFCENKSLKYNKTNSEK